MILLSDVGFTVVISENLQPIHWVKVLSLIQKPGFISASNIYELSFNFSEIQVSIFALLCCVELVR